MPQTRVNIPGVGVVNFPEGMSQEQITQEAGKLHLEGVGKKTESIKAQQAAKYPSAQERGLPTGADLRSLPQRAMAFLSGDTLKEQNPGLLADPETLLGSAVPMAPGITKVHLGALKSLLPKSILPKSIPGLPSKAAAGAKLDLIMSKAENIVQDVTSGKEAAARALELDEAGHTLPKVLRKFNKSMDKGKEITYRKGFDIASKASSLSAKELTNTNSQMQRQIAIFADAMRASNREAAAKVGMGELYDAAIKEYGQAKNLAEKAETLKKWAKFIAIGTLGYPALKGAARDLFGQ